MLKEAYFTNTNIETESDRIYRFATRFNHNRSIEFKKESTALLIVDMQNYFLSSKSHAFIPSSPPVLKRIINFKRFCLDHKMPVIFTRHMNTQENAKMMSEWWSDLIVPDHSISDISPELDTSGCMILPKEQYDAFYESGLEDILIYKKVHSVIVAGVMTNLCCESTVRSAFIRGFEPIIPIDLTATYNEYFHTSTIINLAFGFSVPVLSKHLKEIVRQ